MANDLLAMRNGVLGFFKTGREASKAAQRLDSYVAAARREALEEAARVCDALRVSANRSPDMMDSWQAIGIERCYKAVRALAAVAPDPD